MLGFGFDAGITFPNYHRSVRNSKILRPFFALPPVCHSIIIVLFKVKQIVFESEFLPLYLKTRLLPRYINFQNLRPN